MNQPSWHDWALEAQKEPVIKFEKARSITPEIQKLLDHSTKDKFLGDIVNHKKLTNLVVFYYNDKLVGFAIPRRESDGYHRTGPIYVEPAYRGKGIAKQFVKEHFADKKGRSYIDDRNAASQAVYKHAGFKKTNKSMFDGGERLYEYTKAQVALESLHERATPVTEEPKDGLWFRHESPHQLDTLRPLTYVELTKARPDYDIKAREEHENHYRELTHHPSGTSFLYATVVGYNKMETPSEYPGFTYYFRLSDAQIHQCIFGIADRKDWMPDTVGTAGLEQAKKVWDDHSADFKAYKEKGLGQVDPRIEVVIPFSVTPELYYPQQEDR
jgi:GNAT superfamily N-acetyltransferase